MINTNIIFTLANDQVILKVPDLFCIFRDPTNLERDEVINTHIPYFLEIKYNEDDLPEEKRNVISGYGFNRATGKIIKPIKSITQNIPSEYIKHEFIVKRKEEILHLLLPFTGKFFFDYSKSIQGWFIELSEESLKEGKNRYGQLGFFPPANLENKSELSKLKNEEYFTNFLNPVVLVQYHSDNVFDKKEIKLSDMFEAYYKAPTKIKDTVAKAARLFYMAEGLRSHDTTAYFLYLIYSIESLINVEFPHSDNCKCCGQKIFSVSKKFHSFIQKYYSNYNKQDVNKIYALRSKIVHSGEIILNPNLFFLYEDAISDEEKKRNARLLIEKTRAITKEVINRFLYYQPTSSP